MVFITGLQALLNLDKKFKKRRKRKDNKIRNTFGQSPNMVAVLVIYDVLLASLLSLLKKREP